MTASREIPEDLPVPRAHRRGTPATLTGVVTSGVEPNCLLIDGFLLVGGDRAVIRPGARLTVTGHVDRGVLTTCQQGTPFVVTGVVPA